LREQRGKWCGRLRTEPFEERRDTEKQSFEAEREQRGKWCGRLRTEPFEERRDTEKQSFEAEREQRGNGASACAQNHLRSAATPRSKASRQSASSEEMVRALAHRTI